MKSAKHLLFFFLLLSGSQYLYAQSNYKQGYIITNENDTVVGWIDYRTDKMNSKTCRFKKELANETAEMYVPGQITGYRFSEEGKFYVTRSIEINGQKQTLDSRNVKQYEYTNSKGEKVKIRQDKPVSGNSGKGSQPAHYNAGKEEKLKQHHTYGN